MSDLNKALDRVRKMLSLAAHTDNEAEAALAASRAAKLMEEFQLTEALVRLDDADAKPEAILRDARLEPDAAQTNRKRVAWKETISTAVATDLGVHEWYRWKTYTHNGRWRRSADVRGLGRESAIQTWQYTCQYLWRQIDELADKAWLVIGEPDDSMGTARAWKNSFRIGCAGKISERIFDNRRHDRMQAKTARDAALRASSIETRESLALAIVERDQDEVDAEYADLERGFTVSKASSIGSSSGHGYGAGRAAGERVALGARRAALGAGQGRLKGGK